jgi:hypothetical protein
LIGEVERLQSLDEGEASEAGAHGDILGGLGGYLLAEHAIEEIRVAHLLLGGLVQQGFQTLPSLEETESLQILVQAFQLGGGHGITSRPTRSSNCS